MTTKKGRVRLKEKYDTPHKNEDSFNLSFVKKSLLTSCRRVGLSKKKPKINPIESPDPDLKDEIVDNTSTDSTELFGPFESSESKNQLLPTPTDDKPKSSNSRRKKSSHPHKRDISETNNSDNDIVTLRIVSPVSKRRKLDLIDIFNPDKVIKSDNVSVSTVYKKISTQDESDKPKNKTAISSTVVLPLNEGKHALSPSKNALDLSNSTKNVFNPKKEANLSKNNQSPNKSVSNSSKSLSNLNKNIPNSSKNVFNPNKTMLNPSKTVSNSKKGSKKDLSNTDSLQEGNISSSIDNSPKNSSKDLIEDLSVSKTLKSEDIPLKKRKLKLNEQEEPSEIPTEQIVPDILDGKSEVIESSKNKKRRPKLVKECSKTEKISEGISVGLLELTSDHSKDRTCNDDPDIFEHLPKLDKNRQIGKGVKNSKRRTPKIKLMDNESSSAVEDSKNKKSSGKIESRSRRNKSDMNNAYMLSDRKIVVDNKSMVKSKQNNSITSDKISLSNSCNLNQEPNEQRSSCYTENNIEVSEISDKNSDHLLGKDNADKMSREIVKSPIEANETQKRESNSGNNQQEPFENPQELIGSLEILGNPQELIRKEHGKLEGGKFQESKTDSKDLTGTSETSKNPQELTGSSQEVTGISIDSENLSGTPEPSGRHKEVASSQNKVDSSIDCKLSENTQVLSGNSDLKEMPQGDLRDLSENLQKPCGNPDTTGNCQKPSENLPDFNRNPLETSGNPLEASGNPLDQSGNSTEPRGIPELNETQDFNDYPQETVPHIRNKAEKKIYTDVIFTPPRNKDIKSPTPPKIREKPKVDYDQLSEESYESSHYSPPAYSPIESRISEEHEIIISTRPSEEIVDEISISCLPPGNNECSSSFVESSIENPVQIVAISPNISENISGVQSEKLIESENPEEKLEDDPVIIPMEIPVEIPMEEDVRSTKDDTEKLDKSSRSKNLQIKMIPIESSMGMPDKNPIEILIVPPIDNPKKHQKESEEVKTSIYPAEDYIITGKTTMLEKSSKSSRSKSRRDHLSALNSVEHPLVDSTEIQLESLPKSEESEKPKDTLDDKNTSTTDTAKVKSPKAARTAKPRKRHIPGSSMETSIQAIENPKETLLEEPMESKETENLTVPIDTSDAIVQSVCAKRVPRRKSLFTRRRRSRPKKSGNKTDLDEDELVAEDLTPELVETELPEKKSQENDFDTKKIPLSRSRGKSRKKKPLVPEVDQVKGDFPEDKLNPIEAEESERIPDEIPEGTISEEIVLEQPRRRPPSRKGKKPEIVTRSTKIDLGISEQASEDLTPINRVFDETTPNDKNLSQKVPDAISEANPQVATEISQVAPKESQNDLSEETHAKNSEGIPATYPNRTRRGYLKIPEDQFPDSSSEIIPEGSSENILENNYVSPNSTAVTISKDSTVRLSLSLSKRNRKNNSKTNLDKIEKTDHTAEEPFGSNNSRENPENILDRITERLSKRITKRNNNTTSPDRNSEETSEKVTGRNNDRVSSRTSKRRPKRIPDSPERIPDTLIELHEDPSLELIGKVLSTHDSNLRIEPKAELLNYYPRVLLNMDEIDNYFKQLEEQKLQALGYDTQNQPKSNQRSRRKSVDKRRKSTAKNRRSRVNSRLADEDEMSDTNIVESTVTAGEINVKNRKSNVKNKRPSVKSRLTDEDEMSDGNYEESNIIDGETNTINQRSNVKNRRSSVRSRRSSFKSKLSDEDEMSDSNFEKSTVSYGDTNAKNKSQNVKTRRSIVKNILSNVNSEIPKAMSEIANICSEMPNVNVEPPEIMSEPSDINNKTSPNQSKRSKTNETTSQNKPKLTRKRRRTRTPFGLKRRKRKAPPQIPLEPIEPLDKPKFNADTDSESIGRMESVFFTPPSSRSENENENDSDTNINPKDFDNKTFREESQMDLDNPFGEGTSMNCITPITSKVTTTGSFSSRQFEIETEGETVEDREVASLSSKTTTARSESRVSRLSEVASSFGFDSNESGSISRDPSEPTGTFKTYCLNENSSVTVVQRGQCIEYLKWNNSAKRKSLRTIYSKSSILNRCVYSKTKSEKITSIFDDVLTEPSTSTNDTSTELLNENSTLPKPIDILRQVKEVESRIKSKKVILERLNKCDNLVKSTTELRKRAQGALLELAAVIRPHSVEPFDMESLLYNLHIPENVVGYVAEDDYFI